MDLKRKRGRPLGTGKKDGPFLTQVADMMVSSEGLKFTTAVKALLRKTSARPDEDATTIRRLQVKWKSDGELYLILASERRQQSLAIAARQREEQARRVVERDAQRYGSALGFADPVYGLSLTSIPSMAVPEHMRMGDALRSLDAARLAASRSVLDWDNIARVTASSGIVDALSRSRDFAGISSAAEYLSKYSAVTSLIDNTSQAMRNAQIYGIAGVIPDWIKDRK